MPNTWHGRRHRLNEDFRLMKIFDDSFFSALLAQAAESPRLRQNHNLHDSFDDPVQRMFNALQPGTVIPIHRRPVAETYAVLSGRADLVTYDGNGQETARVAMGPAAGVTVCQTDPGSWHSMEVIEPTILLEVKPGPYRPLDPADILS